MQSSGMMALRAVILLAFLITVPLFAIFGKNAPEVVKALIQNYAPVSNRGAVSLPDNSDAPIFRPSFVSPSNPGDQHEPANLSDKFDKPLAIPSLTRPPQAELGRLSPTSPPNRFPRDHFRVAEQRLRDLGASYYLLETFGPHGDSYRFLCKVASGQNSDQVRAFVAMDHDPLVAMNNVVQQVEHWRAVGHQ